MKRIAALWLMILALAATRACSYTPDGDDAIYIRVPCFAGLCR